MILAVALFTSFGRNLFYVSTPSVVLPSLTTTPDEGFLQTEEGDLFRVEVSPKTVQTVIASLVPTESYYRSLSSTLFWEDGNSAQTSSEVWANGSLIHVKKTLPSGLVRHDILQHDWVYFWYEGASSYLVTPGEAYCQDLAQFIPSYQSILDLDPSLITHATYETKGNLPCIFVSASVPPLFYQQHYWVSAETGLLVAAEIYQDGRLIYAMEGYAPASSLATDPVNFTLPNGVVLSPEDA